MPAVPGRVGPPGSCRPGQVGRADADVRQVLLAVGAPELEREIGVAVPPVMGCATVLWESANGNGEGQAPPVPLLSTVNGAHRRRHGSRRARVRHEAGGRCRRPAHERVGDRRERTAFEAERDVAERLFGLLSNTVVTRPVTASGYDGALQSHGDAVASRLGVDVDREFRFAGRPAGDGFGPAKEDVTSERFGFGKIRDGQVTVPSRDSSGQVTGLRVPMPICAGVQALRPVAAEGLRVMPSGRLIVAVFKLRGVEFGGRVLWGTARVAMTPVGTSDCVFSGSTSRRRHEGRRCEARFAKTAFGADRGDICFAPSWFATDLSFTSLVVRGPDPAQRLGFVTKPP